MANELGELRRTAVVSTFGPGAIVDFRAGEAAVSAVAAGLEQWDVSAPPAGIANPQTIFEPRLQKRLGVAGFRLPPVDPDSDQPRKAKREQGPALTAVRFPEWLQCPQCHLIQYASRWNAIPGKAGRMCGTCAGKLGGGDVYTLPVRFVTACVRGHLDEFPWHFWVNHADNCSSDRHVGPLHLKSEGAGLAGLRLRCSSCDATRSMDGVFSKGALGGLRCRGKRPWLGDAEECSESLRVVQRGASNLYFPVIVSALNIPPWSDSLQRALGQYWDSIVNASEEQRELFVSVIHSNLGINLSPAQIAKEVAAKVARIAATDTRDLRRDEYLQFVSPELGQKDEFEIRDSPVPDGLGDHVASVMRAVRLREVRALSAFTRIHPPSDIDESKYARIQSGRLNWLPAVEVRGEGIFLTLRENRLKVWESLDEVSKRAADTDRRFRAEWRLRHDDESQPSRTITSRFLLLHTLAHVLIRELALDCGYSSASLRERLYVGSGDAEMAGLLIYTASSDSDGTLGGLVRQGQPERLGKTFMRALGAAVWCSSDPLCARGLMSPPENMSGCACHACVLVAETSCEEFNRFLDRTLLIDPVYGYFREVVANFD